jgi:hypothetical protein
MERVAPVPRTEGEMLRDCRAVAVQASISTVACAGCWEGGGTLE